jgi:hypothetical protein
MALLIFILFFLTIFHFVYESILLPTYRLELRYKLFALRDEVRSLKYLYPTEFSEAAFQDVQHSINAAINLLPYMTISLVVDVEREFKRNPHFQKHVERRTSTLEKCKIQDVRNLMDKAAKYSFTALALNSGGWIIYLFPIFLVVLPIMFFVGTFQKLKKLVLRLTVVSEHEMSRLIPQSEFAFALNDTQN